MGSRGSRLIDCLRCTGSPAGPFADPDHGRKRNYRHPAGALQSDSAALASFRRPGTVRPDGIGLHGLPDVGPHLADRQPAAHPGADLPVRADQPGDVGLSPGIPGVAGPIHLDPPAPRSEP